MTGEKKVVTMISESLGASDYVHLHNHTHHSLLDGLTKIPDLYKRVKELGMEAVAITDHGTMSGVLEFYKEGTDSGVKPVLGMEAYVASRSRHDRDPAKDKARYHLTILAMNDTGYKNLMLLSTKANLEGMYYKPRIDHDLLEECSEGLIILSGCASGELGESLRADNYEEAKRIAAWYKSIFGDRYYLEIQDHGHPNNPHHWDVQYKINQGLERISNELGIPMVLTCDGHYTVPDDSEAHEILLCVGTGSFLSDTKRMSLKDFALHVADPTEIIERWGSTHAEAIKNSRRIADRCNVEIKLGGILIPQFPVPEGEDEKSFLQKLVYRGLAVRYAGKMPEAAAAYTIEDVLPLLSKEVGERAAMELGVLDSMGFNGYFLIVQDFINWGKGQGIIFGPGRGSAAGSIVAYALNVTDLDPLKYNLLFERFLNPDRISMPDIDIDIQDTRRDEVIAYCANKYGESRVANIVTFGKMAARAAVRDVARVLQVPYGEADRVSKMIPAPVQGRHIPLKVGIEKDPDLKREYETNPTSKQVIDFAMRLEGTIRSHGVHAAGVVIAPDDIVKYVPLEMAQKGVVSTQYPMGPVEDLGLLKMDFLGLSNLSIINTAMRIIRKVYKDEINLSQIPLDDQKAYELLQRGDTTGVFQLESAGMKRYLRELKPTSFDDIIAMVALYRPGPMQFIDSFIKRKHGQEEITYLHSGMENSLKNTYGILVYQEQFMQISKEWCGFTGGQADTLRKAVGKKKIDLMRKMKVEFVEGAVKHGGARAEMAEKFWAQLEEFANYCFNKSHAACYALIAYWTAYLKAHYPDAFMAALMTSDRDDIDRLAIEISECRHMGLKVLPPDVNQSYLEFAVVPNENAIRFGMSAVKGVGEGAVEEILRARSEGSFVTIEDFAKRVVVNKVNKKVWDSLIRAGGFDMLGDRSDLLFNLENLIAFAGKLQKEALSGQTDLFGSLGSEAPVRPTISLLAAPAKYTDREKLLWERELLGLYISAHPLDNYDTFFEEQTLPLMQVKPESNGQRATVGGIVTTVRTILTKSGGKMAFIKIEDKTGEIEVIVFPNLFSEVGAKLVQDAVLKIDGKIDSKGRDSEVSSEAKIVADAISVLSDEELMGYQSTGHKMAAPKARGSISVKRSSQSYGGPRLAKPRPSSVVSPAVATPPPAVVLEVPKAHVLYVHIKNPDDHEALLKLKRTCSQYPGFSEIVLVLGEDKKSAVRLPFKIETNDNLIGDLVKILGEDRVVIR